MKNKIICTTALLLMLFLPVVKAQTDTSFTIDLLNISLINKRLEVKNPAEKLLFSAEFANPAIQVNDLDSDGSDELILIDYYPVNDKYEYNLYVFSTVDSFYQSALINSGYAEPMIQYSDETEFDIIITGSKSFNYLNDGKTDIYYPMFCWRYEDGLLYNYANDLYDIFLKENDALIDLLDDHYKENGKNCGSSEVLNNIIATVYVNYISAGEKIMAQHFLQTYYMCDNKDSFKSKIDTLLKKEE